MDELERQLLIRDRLRRRQAAARTPQQRLEAMMRLQERTRRMLQANPEGYTRFLRRNYRKRAIDVGGGDGSGR